MIASAIVRRAAALTARITYRDIEVLTRDLPGDGPVLAVSNHFGGAADGILLVYLSDRMPRIVVRDVLLRVPIAGSIMRRIGAIAVHKADDASGDASTNDIMFRSCYQALADGSLVLIFPEGVTQDDPYLAPVKTGAARIALGARASGVENIKILPIGIHYEDKATFRSRVLIVAGAPLDLDELAPELDRGREPLTADNRNAVVALTELIDQTMRSVGPDYQDWEQALDLQLASSTVMRSARRGYASTLANVPLALTEQLAERLAQRPAAARGRICSAARDYRESLAALHLTDSEVAAGGRAGSRLRVALTALLTLLLVPYAIVGAIVVAIPYLIAQSTRLIPLAPAVRATILPLVALLAFVIEWVWLSISVASGEDSVSAAVFALLFPAFAGALIVVVERTSLLWRSWKRWITTRRRGASIEQAHIQRRDLIAAVEEAW